MTTSTPVTDKHEKELLNWVGNNVYIRMAVAKMRQMEVALNLMADDGWLYYGPEGMSEAQKAVYEALKL